jgi:hypothetical protein
LPINRVTIHFGYRQVLYRNRCSLSKIEQRNSFSGIRINIPLMNGMQAALEIRWISPTTKILFLTVVRTEEAAASARMLGDGYVSKSEAGKEPIHELQRLLPSYPKAKPGNLTANCGARFLSAFHFHRLDHLFDTLKLEIPRKRLLPGAWLSTLSATTSSQANEYAPKRNCEFGSTWLQLKLKGAATPPKHKTCGLGIQFDSHRPLQSSWFPVTT